MKTITAKAVREYETCDLYYKLAYSENEEGVKLSHFEMKTARYENVLRKVIQYYFFKRQGGSIPSYNTLLNRWEKLWFPKGMDAYDLAVEQHGSRNLASYTTAASQSLLKFSEDFSRDLSDVVLIDEKFLVPICKEGRLAGSFDIVLRGGDNVYRVLKLFPRIGLPKVETLEQEFAALKLAWDYRSKDDKRRAEFFLYSFANKGSGLHKYIITQESVDNFMYWANKALVADKFYPRRGLTVLCDGCPFDQPCSRYRVGT